MQEKVPRLLGAGRDAFGGKSDFRPVALEVRKTDAQRFKRRLHALELDGDVVVVPGLLELVHALLDRHVAVADDRAAQEVAAAGAEGALARVAGVEGLDDEVLRVDVDRVRCDARKGHRRVLVGAEKVAHVAEQAEILVVDRGIQLLHALGILRVEAVVLDHRADAELLGVFGDEAAALGEAGEQRVKRAVFAGVDRVADRRVVAHALDAEDAAEVDKLLDALDLLVEIAVAAVDEIGADREARDLEAEAVRLRADLFGVGRALLLGQRQEIDEIDELDRVEAELLRLGNDLERRDLAGADHFHVAVGTDRILHW